MTLALRYSIRSDVGLLREGNEDSAYAGPQLLAIADGMGGHAAGEVASAVAISALAPLDHYMAAGEMLPALAEAVAEANSTLHEMSVADPTVEGMGTTLTALLWSGSTVAVCHIGDSRAYLLRDGALQQITRDHTLVQSLVDEGRLTPEAAMVHPQRSLVMRALQSSTGAVPDLATMEGRAGDRYLLCSDGLSDVVTEETLHKTLLKLPDLDEAVLALIELAIRSGGPDNITCVLADVVDTVTGPLTPSPAPVIVGAASNGDGRPRPATDSPAERAHRLTRGAGARPAAPAGAPGPAGTRAGGRATMVAARPDPAGSADPAGSPTGYHQDDGPDEDGYETGPARRRWPIVMSILIVLVLVIAGGGYAAWRYTRDQYFVGTDHGQVVIYRGVNQSVAGLRLYHVYDRTGVPVSGLPSTDSGAVSGTVVAASGSLASARQIVSNVRKDYASCTNAVAAVRQWQQNAARAAKASARKASTRNGRKTRPKASKPAPAPAKPAVPPYCPQAGGAG